jgi:hypothetical protein
MEDRPCNTIHNGTLRYQLIYSVPILNWYCNRCSISNVVTLPLVSTDAIHDTGSLPNYVYCLLPARRNPAPNHLTRKNELASRWYSAHYKHVVSRVAQAVKCLATGWTTGRLRFHPGRGERIFPLASVSRPALGPTQSHVRWVTGAISPGVKRGRGVMLTTHPHLVPRSRMSRSYTSSSPKLILGV